MLIQSSCMGITRIWRHLRQDVMNCIPEKRRPTGWKMCTTGWDPWTLSVRIAIGQCLNLEEFMLVSNKFHKIYIVIYIYSYIYVCIYI